MTKARVAAIVPAFNEMERISAVLDAIKSAKLVDEIVVVSDGSTDGTYELVSVDPDVKAVQLETNRGKGGAMRAGVESTDASEQRWASHSGARIAAAAPAGEAETDLPVQLVAKNNCYSRQHCRRYSNRISDTACVPSLYSGKLGGTGCGTT